MLPRYAPLLCPCNHGAPECEGERETSHSKSPAPPGWYEPRVQATVGTAGRGRSCARMAHPRPRADLLRGYAIPTGLRNGGERYEASRTPRWRREEQARGPTGEPRRPDAVARLCLHRADGWSASGLRDLSGDSAREPRRRRRGRPSCLHLADGWSASGLQGFLLGATGHSDPSRSERLSPARQEASDNEVLDARLCRPHLDDG